MPAVVDSVESVPIEVLEAKVLVVEAEQGSIDPMINS